MPILKIPPELELYYETDTFVEPWLEPETMMLLHGCAESGIVWYDWMPQGDEAFQRCAARHARLWPLDADAPRLRVEPRRNRRRLHQADGLARHRPHARRGGKNRRDGGARIRRTASRPRRDPDGDRHTTSPASRRGEHSEAHRGVRDARSGALGAA